RERRQWQGRLDPAVAEGDRGRQTKTARLQKEYGYCRSVMSCRRALPILWQQVNRASLDSELNNVTDIGIAGLGEGYVRGHYEPVAESNGERRIVAEEHAVDDGP